MSNKRDKRKKRQRKLDKIETKAHRVSPSHTHYPLEESVHERFRRAVFNGDVSGKVMKEKLEMRPSQVSNVLFSGKARNEEQAQKIEEFVRKTIEANEPELIPAVT